MLLFTRFSFAMGSFLGSFSSGVWQQLPRIEPLVPAPALGLARGDRPLDGPSAPGVLPLEATASGVGGMAGLLVPVHRRRCAGPAQLPHRGVGRPSMGVT
jgi:hypothetical protein